MSVLAGGAWIGGGLAAAYGVLATALYLGQRRLLYRPDDEPPQITDPYMAATATTPDGLKLQHAWAAGRRDRSTLVVCHGNAGHLGQRLDKFAPLQAAGWSVMLVGYRGFGGNPGHPCESGLKADAAGVLDWLTERGVGAEEIVLYGESLGTGVATALAAQRPVAGLVLEGGFSSIAAVAQRHYWYVPARRLVRDRFDSLARIGSVRVPLLMLHGTADGVVPPDLGRSLHAAANEPKIWHPVPDAPHTSVWDMGGREATLQFLDRIERERGGQSVREAP